MIYNFCLHAFIYHKDVFYVPTSSFRRKLIYWWWLLCKNFFKGSKTWEKKLIPFYCFHPGMWRNNNTRNINLIVFVVNFTIIQNVFLNIYYSLYITFPSLLAFEFCQMCWKWKWKVKVKSLSRDSLRPHGLQPIKLLSTWDFPRKSAGVDCHFLLQGSFLTQESNPGLPHCRQTVYHLSHQGSLSFSNFSLQHIPIPFHKIF